LELPEKPAMGDGDQAPCSRPGDHVASLPVKPGDIRRRARGHPFSVPDALIGRLISQCEFARRHRFWLAR
jgi:hypothetical protein